MSHNKNGCHVLYCKNLKKSTSSEPKGWWAWNLVCSISYSVLGHALTVSMTYISSSNHFALYLESLCMYEYHSLWLWVSMDRHLTAKYLKVTVTYISWSQNLPYTSKTIWCMKMVLYDFESVWIDIIISNLYDLYFIVQWFCWISSRLFDEWMSYSQMMRPYDPYFDPKTNIGQHDLYSKV